MRAAELEIVNAKLDKEYAGIVGIPEFTQNAIKLALGENAQVIKDKRNVTVQAISGTGALRTGAEFLVSRLRKVKTFLYDLKNSPKIKGKKEFSIKNEQVPPPIFFPKYATDIYNV